MQVKFSLLLLVAFIVACGETQQTKEKAEIPNQDQVTETQEEKKTYSEEENAQILRGMTVVREVQSLLSSALSKAMGTGGSANAMETCSHKAIPITMEYGAEKMIEIRRISQKARNPENQAHGTEKEYLENFERELKHKSLSKVRLEGTAEGDGVNLYYPIVINNPLCLKCHGDIDTDIDNATFAKINELYPEDKASGYALGDLRGAWKITLRDQN